MQHIRLFLGLALSFGFSIHSSVDVNVIFRHHVKSYHFLGYLRDLIAATSFIAAGVADRRVLVATSSFCNPLIDGCGCDDEGVAKSPEEFVLGLKIFLVLPGMVPVARLRRTWVKMNLDGVSSTSRTNLP